MEYTFKVNDWRAYDEARKGKIFDPADPEEYEEPPQKSVTVETITLRQFRDYLNTLPTETLDKPLIWCNDETGWRGGYKVPERIIDLTEIEKGHILI